MFKHTVIMPRQYNTSDCFYALQTGKIVPQINVNPIDKQRVMLIAFSKANQITGNNMRASLCIHNNRL